MVTVPIQRTSRLQQKVREREREGKGDCSVCLKCALVHLITVHESVVSFKEIRWSGASLPCELLTVGGVKEIARTARTHARTHARPPFVIKHAELIHCHQMILLGGGNQNNNKGTLCI